MRNSEIYDASIDPELNNGFPFYLVGRLYRKAVDHGWSEDRFCKVLLRILPNPKPVTLPKTRIISAAPVIDIDRVVINEASLTPNGVQVGIAVVHAAPKPRLPVKRTAPADDFDDLAYGGYAT